MENEFITVEQAAKQIQDYLEGRAEMPKWAAHLNLAVSPRTPKIETVFKNTGEETPEPELDKSAGYLVGGQTVDNLPWKNVPKNRPTYPIPDHKKAMERHDDEEVLPPVKQEPLTFAEAAEVILMRLNPPSEPDPTRLRTMYKGEDGETKVALK